MSTQFLDRQDLVWCLRRMPTAIRELLKTHRGQLAVGGGFIRSCVAGETINDIDLFNCFEPTPEASKAAAIILAAELSKGKHRVVITPNAVTVVMRPFPVQFITRWTYTIPDEILASFDFTISQAIIYNGNVPADDGWIGLASGNFYADLASKRLRYTAPDRNEDAGGSMLRVLKFYQRGYRIPLDSMGAVVARLMHGVDISKIEQKNGRLDEAYLAKILTGLLREVDPNIDPTHVAHLPADTAEVEEPQTEGNSNAT